MKIKLGIIGFGGMGKWHAENAPRAGVEIAAVCDIEEEKQQDALKKGYKLYTTADELLADKEVNTVILTVPNYLHKEMCIKAAKAGKNVITEKPAAMNVQEFDEMEAACKEAGVFFTAHQNRRWDRDMLMVKKAYDENMLGNIFTIESKLHSGNGYMHEWHIYKKYGGGMIYDWGVHLIDQILFMMPGVKIKSIYADIQNVLHEEVDDYFKIIMKMENGITVHIELSTYILEYQPRWLVAGDKGTMIVKNYIDHIYKLIDASAMLDVNMITTFVGRVPDKTFAENLEIFKEVWPPIVKYAEEKGVKIGIENCPMLFTDDEWPGGQNIMTTPANWRKIFEIIDSPNFGINYDPSHFVWQQIDYIKPIYEFKDKIFHVHYKDIKVYPDKLQEVGIMGYPLDFMSPKLPGYGDVDWGKYVSALTDIGYDGYTCIEVEDKFFEGSQKKVLDSLKLSKRYMTQFVI